MMTLKWLYLSLLFMETNNLTKMFKLSSELSTERILRTKLRGTVKHPLDARERKLPLPFVLEHPDQCLGIRSVKKNF